MDEKTDSPTDPASDLRDGATMIADERRRQIQVEGWTPDHDRGHENAEMSLAAACYAVAGLKGSRGYALHVTESSCEDAFPKDWPDKRVSHGRIKRLVVAGALIAAEIDRLLKRSPDMTAELKQASDVDRKKVANLEHTSNDLLSLCARIEVALEDAGFEGKGPSDVPGILKRIIKERDEALSDVVRRTREWCDMRRERDEAVLDAATLRARLNPEPVCGCAYMPGMPPVCKAHRAEGDAAVDNPAKPDAAPGPAEPKYAREAVVFRGERWVNEINIMNEVAGLRRDLRIARESLRQAEERAERSVSLLRHLGFVLLSDLPRRDESDGRTWAVSPMGLVGESGNVIVDPDERFYVEKTAARGQVKVRTYDNGVFVLADQWAMMDRKTKSHPGETLAEMMEEHGFSSAVVALSGHVAMSDIDAIVRGDAPITREIANGLEYVLGTPAAFWIERQRLYDAASIPVTPETHARIVERAETETTPTPAMVDLMTPDPDRHFERRMPTPDEVRNWSGPTRGWEWRDDSGSRTIVELQVPLDRVMARPFGMTVNGGWSDLRPSDSLEGGDAMRPVALTPSGFEPRPWPVVAKPEPITIPAGSVKAGDRIRTMNGAQVPIPSPYVTHEGREYVRGPALTSWPEDMPEGSVWEWKLLNEWDSTGSKSKVFVCTRTRPPRVEAANCTTGPIAFHPDEGETIARLWPVPTLAPPQDYEAAGPWRIAEGDHSQPWQIEHEHSWERGSDGKRLRRPLRLVKRAPVKSCSSMIARTMQRMKSADINAKYSDVFGDRPRAMPMDPENAGDVRNLAKSVAEVVVRSRGDLPIDPEAGEPKPSELDRERIRRAEAERQLAEQVIRAREMATELGEAQGQLTYITAMVNTALRRRGRGPVREAFNLHDALEYLFALVPMVNDGGKPRC